MYGNSERQSIRKKVSRLTPIFEKYGQDLENIESSLKWKSLVLVLGNFSSGKSTLINEIIGSEIQRTGQSPTDDAFTLITAPETDRDEEEIPGSTLLSDEDLPFTHLRAFGENLISHFRMKTVAHPALEELAIIDTPGMLDAITEKDRGYDYDRVIGELAKMSDLIILMFDPHKAGTIREVYNTIRNTLPENIGEDRILFVMSRIDECDNLADLIRSYGTLCWNLSQMTGRKDIPRIFLTYATGAEGHPDQRLDDWLLERNELKDKILAAPNLRFSHILQNIDRQVGDLAMLIEATETFSAEARRILGRALKAAALLGAAGFLFADLVLKALFDWPQHPLLPSLFNDTTTPATFSIPVVAMILPLLVAIFWFRGFGINILKKKTKKDPGRIVKTDSDFRKQQWERLREKALPFIAKLGPATVFTPHGRAKERLKRFIDRELQPFYRNRP